MYNFIKLIIILMYQFGFHIIKGELDYEISVPEFICDENRHTTHKNYNGQTIIGVSGKGKFDFKMDFKRSGNPCRNIQRCNLIMWKVIRDFENYLNNYPYAQSNCIEFNNSMLVPGLKYIFNIFVTQGKTRKQKQFSLDFVDSSFTDSTNKPMASIALIGPPSTEAHMPYILNAKVNICSNISDYYIDWKLLDNTHSFLEAFSDRGPELTIEPYILQSGRQYFLNCSLIKIENHEIVTSSLKSVNVKDDTNTLIVKLPMLYTTMKIQQSINIRPYITDLGNKDGIMEMEWSCIYSNNNFCSNRNDNSLNIEGGFLKEGEYNISITVNKGPMTKSDFSIIKVLKNVPTIEIDTVKSPVLPSSGVEIKANIDDIRTFCTLQWTSEEGPYFLSLDDVPGNVAELREIFVKKDLFLNELEEVSNDVSNKQHNLLIPPPTGNWAGLPNRDQNYKLRFILEAKCPKIQLQDNNIEIEYSEGILNDSLTVSAIVEIDVNVAPKLQPLKVEPSTGVALETVFIFQTMEAVETGTKKPFLYKFGYMLQDREYIFCNMLDYMKCETVLQYNDEGVKTFLEVCNSFNSCERTFGPIVNVTLPNELNEENVIALFREKMNTEDFPKTFGYALTVLLTSKALSEENIYMEHFSREVLNKIQFLLKSYINEANWRTRANKFIRCISDFSKELSFNDEVLNGLTELRSKLLNDEKENLVMSGRKLLALDRQFIDLNGFKSYLQVSDLIITNSKDTNKVEIEKEHLRQKIKQNVGKLCMELHRTREKISFAFKSFIVVVEELPKKSYGHFHVIPYDGNVWNITAGIKFKAEDMEKVKDELLCIAKIVYKDFFNKTGVMYEVKILNSEDGHVILEDIENTVLMPYDREKLGDKIPKCLVYKKSWQAACNVLKFTEKYAHCLCSGIGSYYLGYEDHLPLTTGLAVLTEESNIPRAETDEQTTMIIPEVPTFNDKTGSFITTVLSVNTFDVTPNTSPGIKITDNTDSVDDEKSTSQKSFSNSSITEANIVFTTQNTVTELDTRKNYPSSFNEEETARTEPSLLLSSLLSSSFNTLTTNKIIRSTTESPNTPTTITENNATIKEEEGISENSVTIYKLLENVTATSVILNSNTNTSPATKMTIIATIKDIPEYSTEVNNNSNTKMYVMSSTTDGPLNHSETEKGSFSSASTTPVTKDDINNTNTNTKTVPVGGSPNVLKASVNASFSIYFSLNATIN